MNPNVLVSSQMLISVWDAIGSRWWILILAVPLIFLSWLRSFKYVVSIVLRLYSINIVAS